MRTKGLFIKPEETLTFNENGTLFKPPTCREGRKCKMCKGTLSIYTLDQYCHVCQRKRTMSDCILEDKKRGGYSTMIERIDIRRKLDKIFTKELLNREYHIKGKSVRLISEKYDCSPELVTEYLKKRGIKLRGRGGWHSGSKKFIPKKKKIKPPKKKETKIEKMQRESMKEFRRRRRDKRT